MSGAKGAHAFMHASTADIYAKLNQALPRVSDPPVNADHACIHAPVCRIELTSETV